MFEVRGGQYAVHYLGGRNGPLDESLTRLMDMKSRVLFSVIVPLFKNIYPWVARIISTFHFHVDI